MQYRKSLTPPLENKWRGAGYPARTIFFGIFYFIFCAYSNLNAQTYYFDKYDVRDGLAQSKVYSVVQDKKGFIWAGTAIGVSRFDGVSFRNFSTDSGLAENGVKCVFIDSRGIMWLGHIGGGLTRYANNRFKKIKINNINHDITGITEDANGKIWLATAGDGAVQIENPTEINPVKIKQKIFRGKETLSGYVFSVFKSSQNILFFLTDLGIKILDQKTGKFDFYEPAQKAGYFAVTCIHEDNEKNIWIGTYNGGLFKIVESTGEIKLFDNIRDNIASNWISTISSDRAGNIWVGTWGGGISVIKGNKVIDNFNEQNGLHDNKVRNILEDREGNIIIGSNENGLLIYKGKKFISYSKTDGLAGNQVWAITKDGKGRIWFGTNSGITVVSSTGVKQSFTAENSKLISNQIRYLKTDKSGNVWIGTNDEGVQMYDVTAGDFRYSGLLNSYFPRTNSLVSALEIDKENNLWVGTTEWLVYFEIDNNKIAALTTGDGLSGNDISSLYCDKNNVVWVGAARNGLSRIEATKISKFGDSGNYTVKCIEEDLKGRIWVGTEDRGILVIENGKIVKSFKKQDGLLSDNITVLNMDFAGNIFIGTSAGLNRYNLKDNKILVYSEKSGFTGIEVKEHATYRDDEGYVWFGTINGAFKYDGKKDLPNTIEASTYISRFRVNSVDYPMLNGIHLGHNDRSITIDFGSICLSNAEGVKYYYKLDGADLDWVPALKNQTTVTYSLLPPGEYTFEVKASNNSGLWNKVPVRFNFIIDPPFWRTWWFYVILGVVILGSIFIYIKIRLRHLLRDRKILEEKVKQRTEEVVKEKEKSDALLLNTLPVKVVDDLKKFGKTEPEVFENVTIYFSDICGFTDIAGNLDPKVIISELNELFTAFDDIMAKNHCERIKTIGDGYIAVSGLPEKDSGHAFNIACASLEIMSYLENRKKTHDLPWEIRIGIHSGKVTGGIVGVRKYLYDIFGDTVNTASRMESNSEPMRINCSDTTYELLKDKFRFTKRDPLMVKGKGEMQMYFIEEKI